MEKPNGKLIFYGDEVPITFPPLYNNFIPLLQEILGLDDDFMSSIKLSYRDNDEDKIQVSSEEEYKIFMDEIQKGKEMVMTIEVKEESKLDIKSCTSSILNYVEKKSGNINNLSEQIKNQEQNIDNDKDLDLNENINNNIIMENNIQPKKDDNININIQNPLQPNKNVQVPIKSKKNQNLFPVAQNNNNNINNFNNEINNNNNINSINNINQPSQNQNIPQMSQNNQSMPQKIDSTKLTNKYLFMIAFPYACSLCKAGPIYRIMYYCKDCNYIICPRCEQKEGERHFHPLYKVQNGSQFKHLNINGITTYDMIMDKMEGAYNSVLGFFGAGNNNQNNNSRVAQQQQQVPQLVSVVQLARNIYDLRNVSDQQIEDALIKAQGNIDEAVFSLVPK